MKRLAIASTPRSPSPHGLGLLPGIYVAPTDAMQGEIFRIIFYHVPSAMVAFLFFAISLAGSIGYLSFRRNRPMWAQVCDAWALSGAEVGVVFCTVVLTTALVGTPRLGHLVDMDARLTTTLVLLAHLRQLPAPAPLCRRAAGPDAGRRSRIFGALDVPSSICPTAGGRTQHPSPSSRRARLGMGPSMVLPSSGTYLPGSPGES